VSIHSMCFDEGQSGNCGFECRAFLDGECSVADEMVENCFDELTEEDWETVDLYYGLKKEAYESLRKGQVCKPEKKYTWNKSCLPMLHPRITFFSKE
jgi:hypothetical protein